MNYHKKPVLSKLIGKSSTNKFIIFVSISLFYHFNAMAEMPAVPVPSENPITENKRILGKILFWDEQLSSDNTMACGTCHIPSNGGTDPRPAVNPGFDHIFGTDDDVIGSMGVVHYDENMQTVDDDRFGFDVQVTDRNTPSFINAMYASDLFWDGRALSQFSDPQNPDITLIANGGALESQAVGPILSNIEMAKNGRTWDEVINKLVSVTPLALASNIPEDMSAALLENHTYPELFNQAFGDSTITAARIGMAIATYERTLVSDQTPWDLYRAGVATAMTEDQIQGWEMFQTGPGMGGNGPNCASCHVPPLFTDNKYYNIGLRPAEEDAGRMNVTNDPNDFGRFKTPGLRNIGLKSAMMHVGWITDTMDAIDFYNAGTADVTSNHVQFTANQSSLPSPNPNSPMRPPYSRVAIQVTSEENQAKIADFMSNALTDPRVANETFPFDRPTLKSEITHPINSGLNGGWYNTDTSGQGFMLEILPDSNQAFFAWFTYDAQDPVEGLPNTIGATDQRWLTGLGEINMQEKSITFDVNVTSGGLFDNPKDVTVSAPSSIGSLTITFDNCHTATVDYNFLNPVLSNSFKISRISSENVSTCEKMLTGKPLNELNLVENPSSGFSVNYGLSGGWYNEPTSGQGILLDVLPQTNRVFLTWFTYDTQAPPEQATAIIGNPSHRWLTGLGDIDVVNKTVAIDLNLTTGGKFDDPTPVQTSEANSYGSVILSFEDCSTMQMQYSLFNSSLTGIIPYTRISGENVALCEYLSNQ